MYACMHTSARLSISLPKKGLFRRLAGKSAQEGEALLLRVAVPRAVMQTGRVACSTLAQTPSRLLWVARDPGAISPF